MAPSAACCASAFPQVQVVQADAYDLRQSLKSALPAPAAAIVSSLPLLNKPDSERLALLDDAFALMAPEGTFVQFTYGMNSPVPPAAAAAYEADVSPPVWLNLPPARVWIYRRKAAATDESLSREPRGDVFRPAKFREPEAGRGRGARRPVSSKGGLPRRLNAAMPLQRRSSSNAAGMCRGQRQGATNSASAR